MEECTCENSKNIEWYEYVEIEKHMGFTDYDHYKFTPKYCPFCGKNLQNGKSVNNMEKLFKQVCKMHTQFLIYRYLMANTEGRLDGAEKATRHHELCNFYTAINFGWSDPETVQIQVDGGIELFKEIHTKTQEELTDCMDEVIGFPISGKPNYCKLAPLFFDVFHDIAMKIINKNNEQKR